MKLATATLALALAGAGAALAAPGADAPVATHDAPVKTQAEAAKPTFDLCVGAYAALGRHQDDFGEGSLLSERFPNFARINFNERLATLARQAEKGVSDLKASAEDRHHDFYIKLIDAETEGDMTKGVKDVASVADACDVQYGFFPSLEADK